MQVSPVSENHERVQANNETRGIGKSFTIGYHNVRFHFRIISQ